MSNLEKLQLDLKLTLECEAAYRAKVWRMAGADSYEDKKALFANKDFHFGMNDCALCREYLRANDTCRGCPIAAKVERHFCDRTPFRFMLDGNAEDLGGLRETLAELTRGSAPSDDERKEIDRLFDRFFHQCKRMVKYLETLAAELKKNVDRILSKTTTPQ